MTMSTIYKRFHSNILQNPAVLKHYKQKEEDEIGLNLLAKGKLVLVMQWARQSSVPKFKLLK